MQCPCTVFLSPCAGVFEFLIPLGGIGIIEFMVLAASRDLTQNS